MRGRRLTGALAAAGIALWGADLAGAQAGRQSGSLLFTTQEPGAPSGTRLSVDWRDPANPDGKPYAIARVSVEYPEGTVLDDTAAVQCRASDAELQARGPDACPPASRIGGGYVQTDNGSSAGFPRFLDNDVANFNADDEVIGVGDVRGTPTVPGFTRVVTRTRVRGRTASFDVPPFPGNPPPDNFNAFRTLRINTNVVTNGPRTAFRTPPVCPSSGQWTTVLTFTYRDGVTQTLRVPTPCRAGSRAGRPRLALRLTGRRGRPGCFRGPVRATVTGRDVRRGRFARFFAGRRAAGADRRAPLSRVIDRRRHRGRTHNHVAKVQVRLDDGRVVTVRRRYRVCTPRG